jgi:hypothetical protein
MVAGVGKAALIGLGVGTASVVGTAMASTDMHDMPSSCENDSNRFLDALLGMGAVGLTGLAAGGTLLAGAGIAAAGALTRNGGLAGQGGRVAIVGGILAGATALGYAVFSGMESHYRAKADSRCDWPSY